MKNTLLNALLVTGLLTSCGEADQAESVSLTFQNKAHEMVFNLVKKVGNYEDLFNKKDVIYTYTYQTPDGKKDVSTEKYLFDGELSYGAYTTHQRTFPDLEGVIEQGFNGSEYWLKNNGELIDEPDRLKRVAFNRPTNYYWFTMFQKLLDPGLIYEYIGAETKNGVPYDIVKISFEEKEDKPTDIYQLYINKRTSLVDQFLFTVVDFGVVETPFLMKMEYEEVDGLLIPTKRLYKKSTWNADENDAPWIKVNWMNIKFNNGLTKTDFSKKNN